MSYLATKDYSFNYPPTSLARSAGGFNSDSSEVVGRFVKFIANDAVRLLLADEKPDGVIVRIDINGVAVSVGPFVRGDRGVDTALTPGSRVTGATRQESASGSAEPGFVQNGKSSSVAELAASTGSVQDGGAVGTANTPATKVTVRL